MDLRLDAGLRSDVAASFDDYAPRRLYHVIIYCHGMSREPKIAVWVHRTPEYSHDHVGRDNCINENVLRSVGLDSQTQVQKLYG